MTSYGIATTTSRPFPEALQAVKDALGNEGFGIVAEIDMQATMKNKLDLDIPAYTILGACNPPAARHAMENEPSIGLLLPCNVLVREANGAVTVEAIDANAIVSMTGNAALTDMAAEIGMRLQKALDSLDA
jgi:uncharacterized protein (DUF302 family)